MAEKIYDDDNLIIWKRDSRFYIVYDVGAHQVVMREDEISAQEATLVMKGSDEATKVLFSLQQRLKQSGVDPYVSNIS